MVTLPRCTTRLLVVFLAEPIRHVARKIYLILLLGALRWSGVSMECFRRQNVKIKITAMTIFRARLRVNDLSTTSSQLYYQVIRYEQKDWRLDSDSQGLNLQTRQKPIRNYIIARSNVSSPPRRLLPYTYPLVKYLFTGWLVCD